MKQSTQNTHVSGTPDLAAAQSALTAVGEQYAASNNLSPQARQDLLGQCLDQADAVKKLTGGTK